MKRKAGILLSSIHLDRTANKGIGVQLYMALRDVLLSGALKPGDRLPASRTLAKEAGVSRTTVIDAVDRLVSEGMLVSRVGAGTFVSETLESQRPAPVQFGQPTAPRKRPRLAYSITQSAENYAPRAWLPHNSRAFVTALPALDAFPQAQWARLMARHLRGDRDSVMGYGQPQGLQALRSAIASHLGTARGINCHADQVFVTSGAQHAFALIGQMFVNAGDQVWHENPGAKGARNALVATGAQLVPISIDENGLNVAEGLEKAPHFRLAFATPSHQQPLGVVMSLARRFDLLKAAVDAQALVVEDDYDGEFHFGTRPQPTLKSIDTHGRVLYVGTFSKTLFPSLRLGFIVVPERMIEVFDEVFASWVSGPATVTQAVVADFMQEGHFATHIRMMRRLYKARYEALIEASAALPDTIRIQPADSGFHTVAYVDPAVDVQDLVAQASTQRITLTSFDGYCLAPIDKKGVVFGFGSVQPDDIRSGLAKIAALPALQV
ncbi:PLP-dependent aminotransferase family protein [Roseovarius faecimaris]|uniref:PLP-dependent aminotransferase family protein n=2 Tax=Roseovarius faecimaris TaxID=2494550 RepID=A0A6I6IMR7_9RHOB|nr:PLP-dependent aminotransferase family protein [Roseovarius faecimaris]